MTGVFSGGLVYEYSHEGNGYGLVNITASGEVLTTPDFDALKKAYANSPQPRVPAASKATAATISCPAKDPTWNVTEGKLPDMPKDAEKYLKDGAGDGPGFLGSSQKTHEGGDVPGQPPAQLVKPESSKTLSSTMTSKTAVPTTFASKNSSSADEDKKDKEASAPSLSCLSMLSTVVLSSMLLATFSQI